MGRLDNKVVIITDAASGMGLAAVELFYNKGAKVVVTDIASKKFQRLVRIFIQLN
ncbi:NAD(P)-dependent dehydrogenase (short-subunit alcohol dehydrogenase family) [Virgibacillus natechei]|uniref:NAD(P)-dependent dehydrogenase (Short-subunit alcohol dehydrogenase family) n=1 Tax=Virgibacillus natechei TaxID=1216297 RepID=A0ABS4IG14_9BACI|nr:SDR family NAD(P)-dependent oxidoreductase [Virgibacillus natechei]MBP1969276.1 NAD(P)-dependent dehydrogenase (short-subunit alcohol dehydrogenase family) [Virgibacillus natechei]UZD12431.1 SDR family NAD(P)-dependent oxidoreductase [Virgibacillus natechei]